MGLDVGAHIGEYLSGVYKERLQGGSWSLGRELIDRKLYGRKAGM